MQKSWNQLSHRVYNPIIETLTSWSHVIPLPELLSELHQTQPQTQPPPESYVAKLGTRDSPYTRSEPSIGALKIRTPGFPILVIHWHVLRSSVCLLFKPGEKLEYSQLD
jgi:hypothetical protein